jgi:hypothetical protein
MDEARREKVNQIFDDFLLKVEHEIKNGELTEDLAKAVINLYVMKDQAVMSQEQNDQIVKLLEAINRDANGGRGISFGRN